MAGPPRPEVAPRPARTPAPVEYAVAVDCYLAEAPLGPAGLDAEPATPGRPGRARSGGLTDHDSPRSTSSAWERSAG